MGKSLHRIFLLGSATLPAEEQRSLLDAWLEIFREIGSEAEKLQKASEKWGTASLPETSIDTLPIELQLAAYTMQKYLVSRVIEKHEYYWNAPIMDARFLG